MNNLTGKVAIVTGASRGIGKSIAIELAKSGANVVVNYKSNESEAEKTLEIIKSFGTPAIMMKADVSIYEEAKALINKTLQHFGKVDILINNAGISKVGVFMDMSEDEWNHMLDINFKSVLNCCHNILKYMVNKKSGIIINISSIWGNTGASCEAIYSATKGAVNLFTKSLAKEMAPSNIRVNAIAPGVIETEMNNWLSIEEKSQLKGEIPLGKFGSGEDVAKTVLFLCGEGAKYITGQIITVDGGMNS